MNKNTNQKKLQKFSKNPPEIPYLLLRKTLQETFNTTNTAKLAFILNMHRSQLSKILHGRTKITALTALKLQLAGIGSAVYWIALQRKFSEYLKILKDNGITQTIIPAPNQHYNPFKFKKLHNLNAKQQQQKTTEK